MPLSQRRGPLRAAETAVSGADLGIAPAPVMPWNPFLRGTRAEPANHGTAAPGVLVAPSPFIIQRSRVWTSACEAVSIAVPSGKCPTLWTGFLVRHTQSPIIAPCARFPIPQLFLCWTSIATLTLRALLPSNQPFSDLSAASTTAANFDSSPNLHHLYHHHYRNVSIPLPRHLSSSSSSQSPSTPVLPPSA